MNGSTGKHVGHKVLYGLVIAGSGLIILLSVAGIFGAWALKDRATQAALTALQFVENSAALVRQSIDKVDQPLGELQSQTKDLSNAAGQLSRNVIDKGLVLTLLPEENEENLLATADSVRDRFGEVRETIRTGFALYNAVDRLPFLTLPRLEDDQLDKIDGGIAEVRTQVDKARSEIRDFRANTAGGVDKVQAAVDLLTESIVQVRDRMSQAKTRLATLEALAIRLEQAVPTLFTAVAAIFSLLLAFILFTQVETIRLYVGRWRSLRQAGATLSSEQVELPGPQGG